MYRGAGRVDVQDTAPRGGGRAGVVLSITVVEVLQWPIYPMWYLSYNTGMGMRDRRKGYALVHAVFFVHTDNATPRNTDLTWVAWALS